MKIQESKPDSAENAIAQKQLWITIPEQSQANLNGGQVEAHLNLGSHSRSLQEFEAELATLGGRVDSLN